MLPRRTLEMIVDDCMVKFASENGGSTGWTKDDIINVVMNLDGDQNDVYAAMAIGMDVCFGRDEIEGHYLN